MHFRENYSLKNFNTFGIDVTAKYFAEFKSSDGLATILQDAIVQENRLLVIGQGSNLLFLNDFDGVVIHAGIAGIQVVSETDDEIVVEVGAGVIWDDFVEYCVEQHWYGVENLSLIPGEVGASAIQNIGAYGVEVKDVLKSVKTMCIQDRTLKEFSNADCAYAYRQSIFKTTLKNEYVVLSVVFTLSKKPRYTLNYSHLEVEVHKRGELNLRNVRDTIIAIRSSKLPDPAVIGNAGSFFMNPVVNRKKFENLRFAYPEMPHYFVSDDEEKIPAAWLIQQCGWKGKRLGNAGVYEHQALVLVNHGVESGQEIAALAQQIQADVYAKFGIELTPEVNFIS